MGISDPIRKIDARDCIFGGEICCSDSQTVDITGLVGGIENEGELLSAVAGLESVRDPLYLAIIAVQSTVSHVMIEE